jgi:hypothetical protein
MMNKFRRIKYACFYSIFLLLFSCSVDSNQLVTENQEEENKINKEIQGVWILNSYSRNNIEMKCNSCIELKLMGQHKAEILYCNGDKEQITYEISKSQIKFVSTRNLIYLRDKIYYFVSFDRVNEKRVLLTLTTVIDGEKVKYVFSRFLS